jgi:hypothetical protein
MANYPPLTSVQAAIYSILSSDTTLTDMAPVTNDATEDQTYPYILIANANATPWNTLGGTTRGFGWRLRVTVHGYSRYEGDRDVLTFMQRVVELLNFTTLTIAGYSTVMCELDPDESPMPAKVLLEYPQKVERRHMPLIFKISVHE